MKLEFSRQIFEKYSNLKFHEIRPVGAELFHAEGGQTDRHNKRDDTYSRFSQFAYVPDKQLMISCKRIATLQLVKL